MRTNPPWIPVTTAFGGYQNNSDMLFGKPIFKNKTCSLAYSRFKLKIKPWFMGTLILNSNLLLEQESTCASIRASGDSGPHCLMTGGPLRTCLPSHGESQPGCPQSPEEGPSDGEAGGSAAVHPEWWIQPTYRHLGARRDRRKITSWQRQPENRRLYTERNRRGIFFF